MSGKSNSKAQTLVDQREALHSYLEALLAEVPDTVDEPEAAEPAPAPAPIEPEAERNPAPTMLRPATVPEPQPERRELPEAPASTEPADTSRDAAEAVTEQTDSNHSQVPAWAEESFQCLMFNVAGLSLAVPLVHLNGVTPYPHDSVTPMPNRSTLFLGLTHYQDYNVKVVDTARVVLAENVRNGELAPPEERLNNIILTGGGEWGLACDGIGEVLTLEAADVRWRTSQGKRPWLAGTVREHLCALLDTEGMAQLLSRGAN